VKKFIVILGLAIIVFAGFSIFFFSPDKLMPENSSGKKIYYTVIKNEGVKVNNDKRYEYTLDSYDEKGNRKSLIFTAKKKLREDAYVELYVAPLRGVTYWQEVMWNDMPSNVQKEYIKYCDRHLKSNK